MNVYNSCIITLLIIVSKRNINGTNTGPSHGKVVFCYLASYADHRPGRGNFKLENVNPELCTHLIYAFVLLNETDDSIYTLANWPDLEVDKEDGKNNISKLKTTYPHLKVTVAVGGWQDGSAKYSNMAANSTRRSRFVNNTLDFVMRHDFDGIDLVWQYPSKRGGARYDKLNFIELIKDLRMAYDEYNLLLTASLDSSKDTIDYGYEVPELSKYLHYMLVLSYDFHGKWSRLVDHNAPLYASDLLSTDFAINYLLKLGADPNKIAMGVPLYGRTFILSDPVDTSIKLPGLRQKFKNYTFSGPYTEEDGYLGYNEICLELNETPSKWEIYWDDSAKVPYAINGDKFLSYDNVKSIREKIKFSSEKNLGGVVVWSIDTDDFRGDCREVIDGHFDYPLLRSINLEMNVRDQDEIDNTLEKGDGFRTAAVLRGSANKLKIDFVLAIFLVELLLYLR